MRFDFGKAVIKNKESLILSWQIAGLGNAEKKLAVMCICCWARLPWVANLVATRIILEMADARGRAGIVSHKPFFQWRCCCAEIVVRGQNWSTEAKYNVHGQNGVAWAKSTLYRCLQTIYTELWNLFDRRQTWPAHTVTNLWFQASFKPGLKSTLLNLDISFFSPLKETMSYWHTITIRHRLL